MLPNINQLLFMQMKVLDEEEANQEYKSRIADISETELMIEVPLNENTGRLKRLVQGDELSAYFLSEEGYKYFFSTTVIGFREDVIRLVRIRKPLQEEITRTQRRNFLRVTADLELSLQLADGSYQIVNTDDIGGGGISFLVDSGKGISLEEPISCWLLLPMRGGKMGHVQFKGVVIRMKPQDNK
ncbi:MAG: flagellar brake domain-containing protein, partial [Gorillibacterium sp.]|nr:flagellar brake domain-containing protein [Gorillibacterium sp.]